MNVKGCCTHIRESLEISLTKLWLASTWEQDSHEHLLLTFAWDDKNFNLPAAATKVVLKVVSTSLTVTILSFILCGPIDIPCTYKYSRDVIFEVFTVNWLFAKFYIPEISLVNFDLHESVSRILGDPRK